MEAGGASFCLTGPARNDALKTVDQACRWRNMAFGKEIASRLKTVDWFINRPGFNCPLPFPFHLHPSKSGFCALPTVFRVQALTIPLGLSRLFDCQIDGRDKVMHAPCWLLVAPAGSLFVPQKPALENESNTLGS